MLGVTGSPRSAILVEGFLQVYSPPSKPAFSPPPAPHPAPTRGVNPVRDGQPRRRRRSGRPIRRGARHHRSPLLWGRGDPARRPYKNEPASNRTEPHRAAPSREPRRRVQPNRAAPNRDHRPRRRAPHAAEPPPKKNPPNPQIPHRSPDVAHRRSPKRGPGFGAAPPRPNHARTETRVDVTAGPGAPRGHK